MHIASVQELSSKADERDRLKTECADIQNKFDVLQHQCCELQLQLEDALLDQSKKQKEPRNPKQGPTGKAKADPGVGADAIRSPGIPGGEEAIGAEGKSRKGTRRRQNKKSNSTSAEATLEEAATACETQHMHACHRNEGTQQELDGPSAQGTSESRRLDGCDRGIESIQQELSVPSDREPAPHKASGSKPKPEDPESYTALNL